MTKMGGMGEEGAPIGICMHTAESLHRTAEKYSNSSKKMYYFYALTIELYGGKKQSTYM